MSKASYV